jgi:hypothetical protein
MTPALRSKGLIPEILAEMAINKWDGKNSTTIVGSGAAGININIPSK